MNNIIQVNCEEVIVDSFVEYALDVINDRALPDVRDGLKPVHRRILYAMNELGLSPDKGYKKCARIVGEVLGKYHPHGDTSVYDALVRMAQDFSMRYTLVDGHGNFGSIDGDSPAAMRYTESRQCNIALEMLRDINKNTVKFIDNFDGTEQEPLVLPSRYPNLLANGSTGIAVGVATNIPPHNLSDLIDTIIYQIDNENCTTKDLVKYLKAPDFPTGGIIINPQDMETIYDNGNGKIIVRGKCHKEIENDKELLIITEIPYLLKKSSLIDKIIQLMSIKKINTISEIRDESDRNGMRIVIELKKKNTYDPTLNILYKQTSLQSTFAMNMVYIHNGELKDQVALKDTIKYYIEHQKEVIYNRSVYDLTEYKKRCHILEGLIIALNNLDEIISIIRNSKTKQCAKEILVSKFNLSDIQINSIFKLELHRLTGLEINKIKTEHQELTKAIEKTENIINKPNILLNVLKDELLEIKNKYGDIRRTTIEYADSTVNDIVIPVDDYNIKYFLTKEGYLKKVPLTRLRGSNKLKDEDIIIGEVESTNAGEVILFSNKGIVYKLLSHKLDDCKMSSLGEFLPKLLSLEADETIIGILATTDFKGNSVIVFENGKVARIPLTSYLTKQNRTKLLNALNLDSKVVSILQSQDNTDIILESNQNKALMITTKDISLKTSKNTQGVQIMYSSTEGFKVTKAYIGKLEDKYKVVKRSSGKSL